MNLLEQIKRKFLYKPTSEQENALKLLTDFLLSPDSDEVFLLKGYAGTGKTSLVSALVKTLDELKGILALCGASRLYHSPEDIPPAFFFERIG